jgi:manganese efflux pump family protein
VDDLDLLSNIFIGLSLSVDCFAIALGGCASNKNLKYVQIFRTALAFGIAQFLMPMIGWLVGSTVIDFISGIDHWLAFGLLTVVGGRMIWEAFREKENEEKCLDITRGMLLFTLAVATSVDALAVGLSFAFLKTNIVAASLIIGIVTFLVVHLGFYLGRKAGHLLGQRAKIAGGAVLIIIGLKILLTHLLG